MDSFGQVWPVMVSCSQVGSVAADTTHWTSPGPLGIESAPQNTQRRRSGAGISSGAGAHTGLSVWALRDPAVRVIHLPHELFGVLDSDPVSS